MITAALIAAAAALIAGLVGSLIVAALRGRSLTVQVTGVALTAVGAVGGGALASARAMFISSHDLEALMVVLVAAGAVAVAAGVSLGRRVARSSRELGAVARAIGDGDHRPAGRTRSSSSPATGDLAELARELDDMRVRLDEARRQERALESSRRELVAWVSHDLRTPLAGIRAMAEALADGVADDPETVNRYHRMLGVEADRLALLVDDLFELSRIQAGALHLQLERASLGDLVSDALAASAPVARAKGVRLEGEVSGDAPVLDLSTPELARALRNLLENAIRHTPSDGAVSVHVGVEQGQAVVSVADGCGGIPEADLPRVFEPAFRGENARTPAAVAPSSFDSSTGSSPSSETNVPVGVSAAVAAGGGLGLAIVRGIVEAHAGHVMVHNEGAGCRFTLRLPLAGQPIA